MGRTYPLTATNTPSSSLLFDMWPSPSILGCLISLLIFSSSHGDHEAFGLGGVDAAAPQTHLQFPTSLFPSTGYSGCLSLMAPLQVWPKMAPLSRSLHHFHSGENPSEIVGNGLGSMLVEEKHVDEGHGPHDK